MPVRLIALDIDGTLLDNRWQLTDANRQLRARPGRTRSARSSSVTCHPVRASPPATARPPTPAPTTTAVRMPAPYGALGCVPLVRDCELAVAHRGRPPKGN